MTKRDNISLFLAERSRNVVIYISSDYIMRQMIKSKPNSKVVSTRPSICNREQNCSRQDVFTLVIAGETAPNLSALFFSLSTSTSC